MRVIKSGEQEFSCWKCKSLIGVMPHEIRTISRDYDDPYDKNVGRKYWDCLVCKARNWVGPAPSNDWD